MRQKEDKIGVFVSIVSTKIPFKGTGKEYIGDDIDEISAAVKVDGRRLGPERSS
jgi:DNA topoisomerase VI subunit B